MATAEILDNASPLNPREETPKRSSALRILLVECRKNAEVIDEIPMAYKDIDAVMAAQSDLVEVIYTLRQVVCVKG